MIPRDYQRAAVNAAHDRTAEHGNTMLVLPTGAGKTAIAGFFVGEQAERNRNAKILVLQHTDELIEQNRSAIGSISGLGTSVVKAEQDCWDGNVVFGSVQTLARENRRKTMPNLPEGASQTRRTDNTLVKALARAFRWKRMLESGEFTTIAELAQHEGIAPSYMTRVLRLTLLAPVTVEAILDGRHGPDLTLSRLLEPFPYDWRDQRP